MKVADDLVVSLEYVLTLDDGEEIDRSDNRDPMQFLQGRGQIIPGLEQALYGMRVGDEKDVSVAAADAYGEYDPDNYDSLPRDAFPEDLELVEGMGMHLRDSETDEAYRAYVTEVHPDKVILDFNHPLAGEELFFHVKIAALRNATVEEIDHGHVHDSENGH